ncbi:hypothetical protein ACWDV4_24460 [Micromonospora sp. NPDC003197]
MSPSSRHPSVTGRPDPQPAATTSDSISERSDPPPRLPGVSRMLRVVRRVGATMAAAHHHRVPF